MATCAGPKPHVGQALCAANWASEIRPLVVVTVGGGGDGYDIIKTYLDMTAAQGGNTPYYSLVVTGPLISGVKRKALRWVAKGKPVTLLEFTPDLPSYLKAADLVVSMAGCNTVCEILSLQKRALLIPRACAERRIRAARLAERGLACLLLPDDLTSERLAVTIEAALNSSETTTVSARGNESSASSVIVKVLRAGAR